MAAHISVVPHALRVSAGAASGVLQVLRKAACRDGLRTVTLEPWFRIRVRPGDAGLTVQLPAERMRKDPLISR